MRPRRLLRCAALLLAPLLMAAAPATVDGEAEALAQDATVYAARYDVTVAEAMRRLVAQQASVAATDRLAETWRDRLAGIVLEHAPVFRIAVLLTGDAPVPDEEIVENGLRLPVTFRTGAPATRAQIVAAIEAHQAELAAAFASAPGMGVDERTGALALLVRPQDAGDDAAEVEARLTALAGVPVALAPWSEAGANLSIEGGSRVVGADPAGNRRSVCTSGFVVTDGARTGLSTAAHCPDVLHTVAPDGNEVPLTMIGAWGAYRQDVQIHVREGEAGEPFAPLFYADTERTRARTVATWRNRTSTRVGDFVCHRGERSGYSCAEVAFVDFAPPGALCAGSCPPSWVAVQGPHCRSGDSGGPVFSGTVAFGLVKGASYTADGTCRLYYYMSTDYLPPGWTLLLGAPAGRTFATSWSPPSVR